MRTGLLAQKIGMSRYYTGEGRDLAVTLLSVEGCQVVSIKTKAKEGYTAVQLGIGKTKAKNTSKALRGHFSKAKVEPKRNLVEFRVDENALLEPGQELLASHFLPGQFVDVVGVTIGKGFAGVMKRHNFAGLEASHGVSVSHRSHGSTGQRQDPGKVFKNKKMAGHLGVERVTIQNLEIIDVDAEKGILIIAGAVPGAKGALLMVKDAVKKGVPSAVPFPAGVKQSSSQSSVEGAASSESNSSNEGA